MALAALFVIPGVVLGTPAVSGAQGAELYVASEPPQATVGQPYSYQLQVVGGVAPYTFTIYNSAVDPFVPGLPEGLSITPSGLIHGSPLVAERSEFEYNVSDTQLDSSGGRFLNMTVSTGNPSLDVLLIPLDTNTLRGAGASQISLLNQVNSVVSLVVDAPAFVSCLVETGFSRYCGLAGI